MKPDKLVERVARAICVADRNDPDAPWKHWKTGAALKQWNAYEHVAGPAVAVALEEAAKVCDPKGDCSEMDTYGTYYAAAIRAMKEKE